MDLVTWVEEMPAATYGAETKLGGLQLPRGLYYVSIRIYQRYHEMNVDTRETLVATWEGQMTFARDTYDNLGIYPRDIEIPVQYQG
jgi:hypothetical protein